MIFVNLTLVSNLVPGISNFMKLKKLLGLLFAIAVFSVAASAQLPSLANVGDDVYASEEDGFELAVPDGCMQMTNAGATRTYRCDVAEGFILIQIEERAIPAKTDKDVQAYLSGLKSGFEKTAKTKLVNESPARIGEYRGASYSTMMGDDKTILIALVWEKISVTILGRSYASVANSEAKIVKAVSSFAFNSDN